MKAIPFAYAIATSAVALVCGAAGGFAQQVTGVLGSPEATTTIDGKQLPPPNPPFGGVIKERASAGERMSRADRPASKRNLKPELPETVETRSLCA